MRDGPLFNGSVPDLIHAMLRAPEVSMRAGQMRVSLPALSAGPGACGEGFDAGEKLADWISLWN